MSFRDPHSNGELDQPITLAEVCQVVKAIKIINLLDLMVLLVS